MRRDVTLIDGLTLGAGTDNERVVKALVIQAPTAGDILDATTASERPVPTPDGWRLLASDLQVGFELLRRQIVRIGDDSGPMEMAQLKRLSARDLNLLQGETDAIEAAMASAVMAEADTRGRDQGAGE